jgi:hypothetical protein
MNKRDPHLSMAHCCREDGLCDQLLDFVDQWEADHEPIPSRTRLTPYHIPSYT